MRLEILEEKYPGCIRQVVRFLRAAGVNPNQTDIGRRTLDVAMMLGCLQSFIS